MSTFSVLQNSSDALIWSFMGSAATYTKPNFSGVACTVIIDHGQRLENDNGTVSEHTVIAYMRTNEVGYDIAHNDQLAIGNAKYLVDHVIERDEDNLVIVVELTRQ